MYIVVILCFKICIIFVVTILYFISTFSNIFDIWLVESVDTECEDAED